MLAEGAAALDGRVLERAEAYGKNLFLRDDAVAPRWLHVHLALNGAWRWFDSCGQQTVGRAVTGLSGRG